MQGQIEDMDQTEPNQDIMQKEATSFTPTDQTNVDLISVGSQNPNILLAATVLPKIPIKTDSEDEKF